MKTLFSSLVLSLVLQIPSAFAVDSACVDRARSDMKRAAPGAVDERGLRKLCRATDRADDQALFTPVAVNGRTSYALACVQSHLALFDGMICWDRTAGDVYALAGIRVAAGASLGSIGRLIVDLGPGETLVGEYACVAGGFSFILGARGMACAKYGSSGEQMLWYYGMNIGMGPEYGVRPIMFIRKF